MSPGTGTPSSSVLQHLHSFSYVFGRAVQASSSQTISRHRGGTVPKRLQVGTSYSKKSLMA